MIEIIAFPPNLLHLQSPPMSSYPKRVSVPDTGKELVIPPCAFCCLSWWSSFNSKCHTCDWHHKITLKSNKISSAISSTCATTKTPSPDCRCAAIKDICCSRQRHSLSLSSLRVNRQPSKSFGGWLIIGLKFMRFICGPLVREELLTGQTIHTATGHAADRGHDIVCVDKGSLAHWP